MTGRRVDLWLPAYLAGTLERARARRARRDRLTHILFCVCDHFEPRHGATREGQPQARMLAWEEGYAALQERCRAEFGQAPLHSWFYPPHHGEEHLSSLARWVYRGMGEVELHYHHDGDTEETLVRDLRATFASYRRRGLLLEAGAPSRPSFGFIHGDWALNNARGGQFCGVNDETRILQELGCWADFTLPSTGPCQTRKINSIYYAQSDPGRHRAHDRGPDARVGAPLQPGLMLLQGPLGVNWRAPSHPRVENASLTSENWGREDRIPVWIDCNVHVRGRPEWLFVKLHCHGAVERDFDALFGERAFEMHRQLHERWNDGTRWRLHYVTARQAYNIARAAEHGCEGDPSRWRDYEIAPPAASLYCTGALHELSRCDGDGLALRFDEAAGEVALQTRVGPLRGLSGRLDAVEIDVATRRVALFARHGCEVRIEPREDHAWTGGAGAGAPGSIRSVHVQGRRELEFRPLGAQEPR